jgi:hypothetical protein
VTGKLPLLEHVRRLLERTYDMNPGIDDLGRFVIGDRGLLLLYPEGDGRPDVVGTARAMGPRTLVRDTGSEVRATVYYPDEMIERLERNPPQLGLDDGNVDDFADLVEELDHLLVLASRVRARRPVTLFELELHANVSKHLVLARFLSGRRGRLVEPQRVWLRHHLFAKHRFCDERVGVRRRYEEAARWAVRLLDQLPRLATERRIGVLREFHRASARAKVALVERLASGS